MIPKIQLVNTDPVVIKPPKPNKARFRVGDAETVLFFIGGKSAESDSAYMGLDRFMRHRQNDGQTGKISMHFFDATTLMEVDGKSKRFRFAKPLGPVDDTWQIAFTLFVPNLVIDPFPPLKEKPEDKADIFLPWVPYGHTVVMHVYASTKPTVEAPPYGQLRLGPFIRHGGKTCWLCFHEQKISRVEKKPIEEIRAANIFDTYTESYPDYPGTEMTLMWLTGEQTADRCPTGIAIVLDKRSVRIHPLNEKPTDK